jgi:hypothetical protein
MALYQITVSGATSGGSTAFFDPNVTTFTPIEAFTLGGFLLTADPQDPVGASGNGVNLLDIGLVIGTPFDLDVRAGELVWSSNNALHPVLTGESTFFEPLGAIDEVFQSVAADGTLVTQIDPNRAPQTNTDFYVETSGLLGIPRQIVGGELDMTFSADGTSVSGVATLFGGGFIEPGTFAWGATFQGVLIA